MTASAFDRARLVLWDIDGTLVRTSDIGAAIFDSALETVLGKAPARRVQMSGKTDPQIVGEYLTMMAIEDPHALRRVLTQAEVELALRSDELAARGTACPGVRESIEALDKAGVIQTLLTGNIRPNARVKLTAFDLDRYFDFDVGAFGSDDADRTKLVPIALERLAGRDGRVPALEDVWVIGDSPNDLACARAGGVRSILVATGRFGFDELELLAPDAVMKDMTDVDSLVALITGAD